MTGILLLADNSGDVGLLLASRDPSDNAARLRTSDRITEGNMAKADLMKSQINQSTGLQRMGFEYRTYQLRMKIKSRDVSSATNQWWE